MSYLIQHAVYLLSVLILLSVMFSLISSVHVCFIFFFFCCFSVFFFCMLVFFFFFSSRRRHTRCLSDWSSDVCSSDLGAAAAAQRDRDDVDRGAHRGRSGGARAGGLARDHRARSDAADLEAALDGRREDRKSVV